MARASQEERGVNGVGRAPPQNIDAEESALGSMMIEKTAMEKGLEILRAEDFYRPVHQEIFGCFAALAERGEPPDLITLQEELRKRGKLEDCGGTEYLMGLTQIVPTAANIKHYAGIVEQKAVLRGYIAAGTQIVALAMDEEAPVEEVAQKAELLLRDVTARRSQFDIRWLKELYGKVYDDLPTFAQSMSVPITIKPLARACVAMMKGELIVLAARARVGKSAFAMQLLVGAGRERVRGAMISCEMTPEQLVIREIAKESGVPVKRMFTGELDERDYSKIGYMINDNRELPICICAGVGRKMGEIAAMCRRLVGQGIGLIVIDHIHRISPDNDKATRYQQVGQIAKDCKDLALQLRVPIIALAQLNRRIEDGGEKRPNLSDLRDSGAIEENADVVWFLWRNTDPRDQQEERGVSEAELIVAKNRMLPEAVVELLFEGSRFRFLPRDDEHEEPRGARRDGEAV